MGNLVSLHKNDFDRIYAFLRFFGKKIILRTSEGYIFYKNDDKTCSLKDFTESIIDNIYKGSFEHLVIEIFEDIESKDFNDFNDSKEYIFIDKDSYELEFKNSINNLELKDFETYFNFSLCDDQIIITSTYLSSLDFDNVEMEIKQKVLINFRNKWIREGRIDPLIGVGTFGIIL